MFCPLVISGSWNRPLAGFLASIPVEYIARARQFAAKPEIAHVQSIMWGSGPDSVLGVTELTECVRTEDLWLLEVQHDVRHGSLSEDNWNVLHGRPTTVPGSWIHVF